jgi:hypothetical protein
MPQNKNLTQICFSIRGFGKRNGVIYARKKALARKVSKRYQKAGKKEKAGMLNELVKTAGYDRKHLLHALADWGETARLKASPCKRRKGGGRKPKYTGGFVSVLRKIGAFFSFRCGKILAPFMREQTGFLEVQFYITEKDKALPLSAGPSTIDRALKPDKKKLALKGKSGAKPGKHLKKWIPARTYYADVDKTPGFFKIDTVYHCGTSDSGEFCLTLTATDVYSGWVELRHTLNKAHKWVFEALLDIKPSPRSRLWA